MNYLISTEIKEMPELTDLQIDDLLASCAANFTMNYSKISGKSLSDSIIYSEHSVNFIIDDKEYIPSYSSIHSSIMKKLVSYYRDDYCYCIVVDGDIYREDRIFWKCSSAFTDALRKLVDYYSGDHVSVEKITIGEAIDRLTGKDKEENEDD